MKKTILIAILIFVLSLHGCTNEQTYLDYFYEKMTEMHEHNENYSYSVIHQEINVINEEDAIIIFYESRKGEEEAYILAYIQKENEKWEWKQTNINTMESPWNWKVMTIVPIYSGILKDSDIISVTVGNIPAEILEINDNMRFWFSVNNQFQEFVKVVKADGTEDFFDNINTDFSDD